jgi:carotenoid 1,2-hydratase
MQILSNFSKDVRQPNPTSGGYEWWYFDGISSDDRFSFVVILYEGNPFSTRYNGALLVDETPSPVDHPAISISIYEQGKPIYYSFTEFDPSDCHFDDKKPLVTIGDHKMEGNLTDDRLHYELMVREKLPNGDGIRGTIRFQSDSSSNFLKESDKENEGHTWNLVQPRAKISATLTLDIKGEKKSIKFKGQGYHDHNTGREPMRTEFDDWYWGRFHFENSTLVYYVMNRLDKQQHRGWLFNNESFAVLHHFDEISLADKGLTLFGLNTAHKLGFKCGGIEIQVQQSNILDNGPFYRRYQSDAFLKNTNNRHVETTQGISEYIRPDRIYTRTFWPFVNMRIWYKPERPHWVQRSKRLYRWTW